MYVYGVYIPQVEMNISTKLANSTDNDTLRSFLLARANSSQRSTTTKPERSLKGTLDYMGMYIFYVYTRSPNGETSEGDLVFSPWNRFFLVAFTHYTFLFLKSDNILLLYHR